MSDEAIEDRIRRLYPEFSPAERQVADVILVRLDTLAAHSATELAQIAGVSKASVSRLMRRLGFHGAEQLRAHLRLRSGAPSPAATDSGLSDLLSAEIQRQQAAAAAFAELPHEVVRAMADARRILVIGYRNSHPLALHLRQQLLSVRGDVHLAPAPGQSISDELVGLGPQDLVIVVGFRRRASILPALIDAIADSPARSLLIADPSARALAPRLTWSVECPIAGPGSFDSYGAAMFLISLLAGSVAEALGPTAFVRVEAIGAGYTDLNEIERS